MVWRIVKETELLIASITKDLNFYTSDFCRKEMDQEHRKELLHHLQGKREALELISGEHYSITENGLQMSGKT